MNIQALPTTKGSIRAAVLLLLAVAVIASQDREPNARQQDRSIGWLDLSEVRDIGGPSGNQSTERLSEIANGITALPFRIDVLIGVRQQEARAWRAIAVPR
jgi:hypothetical protein